MGLLVVVWCCAVVGVLVGLVGLNWDFWDLGMGGIIGGGLVLCGGGGGGWWWLVGWGPAFLSLFPLTLALSRGGERGLWSRGPAPGIPASDTIAKPS